MDEDEKETRANLSLLCNRAPMKTHSFHPTRSRIAGDDNLHKKKKGHYCPTRWCVCVCVCVCVCEGILTLVNGKTCLGNLVGQMCEPQN